MMSNNRGLSSPQNPKLVSVRVESVLYGENAPTRDQARAELIRSGSAQELLEISAALSSTLDTTRRRATRLLSDIQPHRARPAITQWITQLETQHWQANTLISTKAFKEGVAHAARLLNQLTVRGEREIGLIQIYRSGLLKAQRACICPAAPSKILIQALHHEESRIIESALIEILRRLDQIEVVKSTEQDDLCSTLKQHYTPKNYQSFTTQSTQHLRLWTRLFAHLYPQVDQWATLETLYKLDLLLLYNQPLHLLDALEKLCTDQSLLSETQSHSTESQQYMLAILSALEQRLRVQAYPLQFSSQVIESLQNSPLPQIRSALARLSNPESNILKRLGQDNDQTVRWCVNRAQQGSFDPYTMRDRLGAHERLELPSAKPPYGLRAFDEIPKIQRVKGALAMCQARFDVNLGVAMRSAEAAGLQEVFVIGARSGSLTSARGAEHAIPVHWLPDAQSLISRARQEGYQLVAVQQTPDSEAYHQANYPPQPLFILGSEDSGLPDALRLAADLAVEIPLFGAIDSLNVATAATCVMMHWRAHLSD